MRIRRAQLTRRPFGKIIGDSKYYLHKKQENVYFNLVSVIGEYIWIDQYILKKADKSVQPHCSNPCVGFESFSGVGSVLSFSQFMVAEITPQVFS